MPIYEFYCSNCHTVFSFFSSRIDTKTRPSCPRCERAGLERKPSRFATPKNLGNDEPDALDGFDESKLEGAMESLAGEMGDLGEGDEDPRTMARLMRRFSQLSGLEMGDQMADLVQRLEAGEDPESLEAEMDDALDDDTALDGFFKLKQAAKQRAQRPAVDEKLYFL